MTGAKWTVYWGEYSANTYLYGSEVTYLAKDDVEFRNRLMPPGTVIKEWYSKTNFQLQKIEPTLPIIDGESTYEITVHIETAKEENWLMRLVFYDKYEMEAGTLTLRDGKTEFRCPLKTYSYKIQLINGGMTHFHFHSMTIREIADGTDENPTTTE